MAVFRIPLTTEAHQQTWLDDVDLPRLLVEAGATPDVSELRAVDARGTIVPVQWLDSANASAIPGHMRGTLAVEAGVGPLELLVRTGAGLALADDEAVSIKDAGDVLEISTADKPIATYHFNTKDPEVPRPYFHPLIGPTGKVITQMGEIPGQKKAHFHHTALWISHQKFTPEGQLVCNNWQIGKNRTRMKHVKFAKVESGPMAARFVEQLDWLNTKEEPVLAETRMATIPKRPADARVLDFEIVLTGQKIPVTLNKTPYHILAVRVVNAMLPRAGGVILNSEGQKNPKDGTPAKWIDISGKLDDAWQGVALFDHPDNLRHPTPCLQFAGQTIGLSPTHREEYKIEPGKSLKLRYRVLIHAGDADKGKVAAEYERFSKKASSRLGRPREVRV